MSFGRLRIIRTQPVKAGKEIVYDADDRLSSFPGQKGVRRIATPEQQKQRGSGGDLGHGLKWLECLY